MAKNIDTVVFSCVIEVKGTSVMDEKLILKIIDSLINNRWLVINATHDLLLYFCWHFLPHRSHFPVARTEMQRRVTGWLHFSVNTTKYSYILANILPFPFPFPPSCPSPSLSPRALLCLLKRYVVRVVVRVPSSIGVSYTGQQFKCRSQPRAPHQCLALFWLNRFTSAPHCLILLCLIWSILSNSFCFTCNKYGNLTGEIQGIVVYRWPCVLCR